MYEPAGNLDFDAGWGVMISALRVRSQWQAMPMTMSKMLRSFTVFRKQNGSLIEDWCITPLIMEEQL
jgi:hypothetical protein